MTAGVAFVAAVVVVVALVDRASDNREFRRASVEERRADRAADAVRGSARFVAAGAGATAAIRQHCKRGLAAEQHRTRHRERARTI